LQRVGFLKAPLKVSSKKKAKNLHGGPNSKVFKVTKKMGSNKDEAVTFMDMRFFFLTPLITAM